MAAIPHPSIFQKRACNLMKTKACVEKSGAKHARSPQDIENKWVTG
jgi:hypothetical protein